MGVTDLNGTVTMLWDNALSERTMDTYSTAVKSFKTFLLLNNISSEVKMLPEVSEDVFLLYIAHCYRNLQIKHSTIKLYLSGIRFEYLKTGTMCPLISTGNFYSSRINALLHAVKRIQGQTKHPRHPITASVLNHMCSLLDNGYVSLYTDSLLKAAFITSFCGFLRCAELTTSKQTFDPSVNVCLRDVTIYDTHAELTLKSSKTDPYRQGVSIPLFKNVKNGNLCPHRALSTYTVLRNKQFPHKTAADSPFFLTENGEVMCRSYFILHVKLILSRLGYNTVGYSGHSFRIGAASTAASCRLEDHLIRTLGRWSSDCYRTYIRTPLQVIRDAQSSLLQTL